MAKVLLAQFPLEVHSRGLTFVANLLRDAGHEVVVLGNARPMEIGKAAQDEDVDVVGISAYCGGELEQGWELTQWVPLRCKLMIGGCIPGSHVGGLRKLGFEVFTDSSPDEILLALDRLPAKV